MRPGISGPVQTKFGIPGALLMPVSPWTARAAGCGSLARAGRVELAGPALAPALAAVVPDQDWRSKPPPLPGASSLKNLTARSWAYCRVHPPGRCAVPGTGYTGAGRDIGHVLVFRLGDAVQSVAACTGRFRHALALGNILRSRQRGAQITAAGESVAAAGAAARATTAAINSP